MTSVIGEGLPAIDERRPGRMRHTQLLRFVLLTGLLCGCNGSRSIDSRSIPPETSLVPSTAGPTSSEIPPPSPPPASLCASRIAFVDERGGQTDLFSVTEAGTGTKQLTSDAASEWSPNWSPDSSSVAFESDRDGNREIYVVTGDGGSPRRLTRNPGDDWSPSWSPSGDKIAFFSDRLEGAQLYLMGSAGTGVRPIAGTEGGANPSWSPDGRQIAFRKELPGNDEIFIVDLGTGATLNVSDSPANDFDPAWSPDGERIAFDSVRDGPSSLYAVQPDGSDLRRLTVGQPEDQFPSWSSDGNSIAFARHGVLWVMNADGTGQRPLGGSTVTGVFPTWGRCQ